MSTIVVAPGPGSILVGDEWHAGEVEMQYEDMSPELGTDTIAVLQLNGKDFDGIERQVVIELTRGDLEELRRRIDQTIGREPRSAIEARTGIPLEELL